jgi:hypothetical protein
MSEKAFVDDEYSRRSTAIAGSTLMFDLASHERRLDRAIGMAEALWMAKS